jgi:hypothetical protein
LENCTYLTCSKRSLVCNNPFYLKLDLCFLELLYIVNCVNPLHWIEQGWHTYPITLGTLFQTITKKKNFKNKDLKFIFSLLCALFMKNVMHVPYRKGWLNKCYVMKEDWSRIYRGLSLLQSNKLIHGVSCKSPQIGNLSCRALQVIKANGDKEPHQNKLVQITKNKTTWEIHLTIILGICN